MKALNPAAYMNKKKMLRTARLLFFALAIVWLMFGVQSVRRLTDGPEGWEFSETLIAAMMFANAGAYIFSGSGIGKWGRTGYVLGLAVVVVNMLLTLTDQIGVFDMATFALNLVLLTVLIIKRSIFQ